jgi:predicted Zn-dependent peptidase
MQTHWCKGYTMKSKITGQEVSEREMDLVRNYLNGDFARLMDGPFSLSELYMHSCSLGLDVGFYEKQMEIFQQINAREVMELATTLSRSGRILRSTCRRQYSGCRNVDSISRSQL